MQVLLLTNIKTEVPEKKKKVYLNSESSLIQTFQTFLEGLIRIYSIFTFQHSLCISFPRSVDYTKT